MARKYVKKSKRRGRRVARKGQRRIPRTVRAGVPDIASLTEVKELPIYSTNQMYQAYNIQLSTCPRAVSVAKGYQLYRIKRVTFKLSPLLDTFAAGSNTTVPYLYYMIDRTKNLIASNSVRDLQKAGAKPRRVDDKQITFSYRPSVLTSGYDGNPPAGQSIVQFSQYRMSPWLNTRDQESIALWNPDSTDHQGIVWMVQNAVGGSDNISYKMDLILEFEFKKPSYQVTPSDDFPPPLTFDLEGQ